MLFDVPVPASFGVSRNRQSPSNTPVNVGEVQNKGFELSASYRQTFGAWNIDISGNASFNKNEVQKLNRDQFILAGNGGTAMRGFNLAKTEAGHPMGMFWGWVVEDIFRSNGEVQQLNDQVDGFYQEELTSAGDFKYRDINSEDSEGNILYGQPDGKITTADQTFIGNPWPDMTYGLSANIAYKDFDLSLLLQGVQGVSLFNANKAYSRTVFADYNTTTKVFERWTPENPDADHPRLISTDPNGNFRKPSSYFVEDGSYLKLRNIQLGYTLSSDLLRLTGLRNARIYINAQNILTFTGYSGLDPEMAGGNTTRGVDGQGMYPQTRLISTGIQVGF